MLRQLSIQNFKGWRDTGPIRLAPITVFFGSNSAGKTSLLQFLLMLRQTCESRDRKQVLYPGDENADVDLGNFSDLVFQHDVEKHIEFSLTWNLEKKLQVFDPLHRKAFSGEQMSFGAEITAEVDGRRQIVESMWYRLGDREEPGWLQVGMKRDESHQKKSEYRIEAARYELVRNQGRAWPLSAPLRFYGFPEEVLAYYQNAGFTSDLALSLERHCAAFTISDLCAKDRDGSTLGPVKNRTVSASTAATRWRHYLPQVIERSAPDTRSGRSHLRVWSDGGSENWVYSVGLARSLSRKAPSNTKSRCSRHDPRCRAVFPTLVLAFPKFCQSSCSRSTLHPIRPW